jgi:hypothetical protein
MRSLRFRLTIRHTLVVIAVAALVFGGEVMRRRRSAYVAMASEAFANEQFFLGLEDKCVKKAMIAEKEADTKISKALENLNISIGSAADVKMTYLGQSRDYSKSARNDLDFARKCRKHGMSYRSAAGFHADLRRRYEQFARMPWKQMGSMPPEPNWRAEILEVAPTETLPRLPTETSGSVFDPKEAPR